MNPHLKCRISHQRPTPEKSNSSRIRQCGWHHLAMRVFFFLFSPSLLVAGRKVSGGCYTYVSYVMTWVLAAWLMSGLSTTCEVHSRHRKGTRQLVRPESPPLALRLADYRRHTLQRHSRRISILSEEVSGLIAGRACEDRAARDAGIHQHISGHVEQVLKQPAESCYWTPMEAPALPSRL
ncbi:hypothetical protein GGS23DRAFT_555374 [Durotheca rogersii]|uniref:uncharacterized protein n=1 Tax=Durotheca rogersii TaxID=419775 RepID=UPI00221F315F|nr:uncharacterized protein GGS23DRAFT_555374 [Durotheca rogersii]KAI5866076.1 hypothetical protein GGS23DRAFT_555374 [Durotheca rogersii]